MNNFYGELPRLHWGWVMKGMRWNWCFRIFYPSLKSGICPLQKMTWQKGTPKATGCQCPADPQLNANAATLCLRLGWPAGMMEYICKTAQLGHLSTSKGERQYQDKKTIERSLLFRLNNILKQIESNYNCLILPDDMTPSESHREKKFFWKENYAFAKYVVEKS